VIEEIVVLEDRQHADVGNQTTYQKQFSSPALGIFNPHSSEIIDYNGKAKDQDIDWNEGHIEIATADQQQKPSPAIGHRKKQRCDNDEKEQEVKGIKKHILYG
jgi:hypothetical protein